MENEPKRLSPKEQAYQKMLAHAVDNLQKNIYVGDNNIWKAIPKNITDQAERTAIMRKIKADIAKKNIEKETQRKKERERISRIWDEADAIRNAEDAIALTKLALKESYDAEKIHPPDAYEN